MPSHITPRAITHASNITAEVMTRRIHIWPRLAGATRFTHAFSAEVRLTGAIVASVICVKIQISVTIFSVTHSTKKAPRGSREKVVLIHILTVMQRDFLKPFPAADFCPHTPRSPYISTQDEACSTSQRA